MLIGIVIGFLVWFTIRFVLGGFFTVQQNERVVKTSFGRAIRLGNQWWWMGRWARPCAPTRRNAIPIPRQSHWPWWPVFQVALGEGLQG